MSKKDEIIQNISDLNLWVSRLWVVLCGLLVYVGTTNAINVLVLFASATLVADVGVIIALEAKKMRLKKALRDEP